MGTNFYIAGGDRDDSPDVHIGKRSAAGLYCWDCKETLCKGGIRAIHAGNSIWYKDCPSCFKPPCEENLGNSTAGRELGFNDNPPARKQGVASASSFTWAMPPAELMRKLLPSMAALRPVQFIEDEYGRKLDAAQFLQVLEECPIQFYESIGSRFF